MFIWHKIQVKIDRLVSLVDFFYCIKTQAVLGVLAHALNSSTQEVDTVPGQLELQNETLFQTINQTKKQNKTKTSKKKAQVVLVKLLFHMIFFFTYPYLE